MIPDKVITDETYFPEKDFEAHLHKEKDTNAMYYESDTIISLPNDLADSLDLNLFYSFGLLNTHTLPYSILYQKNDEFKFMNDIEKKRYYDKWIENLITVCSTSKVLKGVAIQKTKKALIDATWDIKLLDFVIKTDMDNVNMLVINLDDKDIMYYMEEEGRTTNIILLYCNKYYYPLIHMYYETHPLVLFQKLKQQFTKE